MFDNHNNGEVENTERCLSAHFMFECTIFQMKLKFSISNFIFHLATRRVLLCGETIKFFLDHEYRLSEGHPGTTSLTNATITSDQVTLQRIFRRMRGYLPNKIFFKFLLLIFFSEGKCASV